MKKIACVVSLFVVTTIAFAQTTQKCIVRQYNQRNPKTPLSGVTVIAKNSNTAVSTDEGKVTLSFNTLKPGDRICDVVAIKEGYEIYNKEIVKNWIISRNQSAFELLMIRSDFFAQNKARITRATQENYKKKYEQANRKLRKLQEEGKIKEEEFMKQYNELNERYHNLLKNIDRHIDQVARIDLSEISAKEQRIIEMIEEGKIVEAIEAYDSLELIEKSKSEVASYKIFKREEKRMHEEKIRSKRNIDETYESIQRWISILFLEDKTEDAEEILDSLLEIIVPLFHDYPDEYRPKVAKLHYQLGKCALEDYHGGHEDKAKKHFFLAEKEYLILTEQTPELYRSELAQVQELIGLSLVETDDLTNAEQHYIDAMNNWSILTAKNPENPEYLGGLAHIQHLLGKLYLDIYQDNVFGVFLGEDEDTTSTNVNRILQIKSKAESLFESASDNYNSIIFYNSDKYRLELAKTQRDLGWFYMFFQDYSKSEDIFTALIQNMKEALAHNDSVIYVKTMADAQQILANEVYRCMGQHEKREDCLFAALDNCFRHLTSSPDEIAWTYQCIFDDLSNFYYSHFSKKKETFYETTFDKCNQVYNETKADRIRLLRNHIGNVLLKYYEDIPEGTRIEKIKRIQNIIKQTQ